MKIHFKKHIFVAVIFSAIVMQAPLSADAQVKNICQTIDASAAAREILFVHRYAEFKAAKLDLERNILEKRNEIDASHLNTLFEVEKYKNAEFSLLRQKAETSEQKQATEQFISRVNAAIITWRAEMNKAVDEFNSNIDTLIEARKKLLVVSVENFKNAVDSAISEAQKDCDDDAGSGVKIELKDNLKAARAKLMEDKVEVEIMNENLKAYIEIRRTLIDRSYVKFVNTIERAKADYKNKLR